jgi:hypothetical protein
MALWVNAATPSDDDAAAMNGGSGTTVTGFVTATLSSGNNTVTAKYRVGGGTGTFQRRKIVAFRYANP